MYAQELRPEHYQLFTIRPDGSGAKQITHLVVALNPDWSPNGKTIVAEVTNKSGAGITLLSPAGTVIRNLTPKGFQGSRPFRRTATGSCTSATSPAATTASG